MALAIAFDAAKTHQLRLEGDPSRGNKGGITQTYFFGSRKGLDSPQAKLSKYDPGRVDGAHFHIVDQFQIVMEGTGRLGRHPLHPYCVHFSRAFTPYGPLLSDISSGFSFFVLRARPDPGSQRLPQERDKLKHIPHRNPWQITRPVTFSAPGSSADAAGILLNAIADIKDKNGLAAHTLSMRPNTITAAPDPSQGEGQYLVVVTGSLWHNNQEHKAPALVFVWPNEGALQIQAGNAGLEALVLNFPRKPETAATAARDSVEATSGFKIWQCALCSFAYDEAKGLPEEGIAAGTRWQHVPEAWTCPDCSSSKQDFESN